MRLRASIRSIFLLTSFYIMSPILCWAQNGLSNTVGANSHTQRALKAGISNLREITLKPGVNNVFFDGIGESAQIIVATQHGVDVSRHSVFFVVIKDQNDNSNLAVVSTDSNDDYTIEDELDDGFFSRSIRFLNGMLKGVPQTFLFVSTLNGSVYDNPGPTATILVETLQQPGAVFGDTRIEFSPILQFKTKATYYDANKALLTELNIPLPSSSMLWSKIP